MKFLIVCLIFSCMGCSHGYENELQGNDVVITVTYPNVKNYVFIKFGELKGKNVKNYEMVIKSVLELYANDTLADTVLIDHHDNKGELVRTDTVFKKYEYDY